MAANLLLGVDLRHLVALEIVARERSFARAAAQLGYTQSAVSQQIAALERAAGARLLERPRGRGIVEPTEAGALLLRHAERIVASLRAAEADLRALASGTVGSLRVGTFQSVGITVLPPLLSRYRAAWPGVEVTLIESGSPSELVGGVERGELDLTFWSLPLPDGPFEILELMLDPHVLLVPRGSPLASRDRRVSLRELVELPLIGYRHPLAYDAEAHLRARGIAPRFVFRSDESATIQGLVASGFAAAIVPRLTVNLDDQRVQALDVGSLIPPRTIVLVRHGDRYSSPATQAFQEIAREVCAELSAAPISARVSRRGYPEPTPSARRRR
jgi:DNA-binding transcriptional LysR family regulator